MTQEEVLGILKECDALLEGHFELRSGLHSARFFQCANVLRYPRKARRLCEELAAKLREAVPAVSSADTVISPAMGGVLVGHEVAGALDKRSIFAEKQDDKLVLRRFNIAEGERVIVAEDVITRGGRVQETLDIVKACGGDVVAIALLVDRSGGKATFDYPTVSLLEMEPVAYEPSACPLCKQAVPLVHPGS